MNILVVGGAGYIGSHAVLELLKAGFQVTVIDNLSTGSRDFVPEGVKFYLGDITKKADIDLVFKENKIDCVIHFAAKIVVFDSVTMPLEYYHNNVEGVRVLLSSMVDYNVKNIVFSSTAAVYGQPKDGKCREDDLKVPINPYGETKLACERLIHWVANAHGLNYVIFRYFNVAGADQSLKIGLKKDLLTHLIPIACQTALGIRKEMKVNGDTYPTKDGTCIRDYIHVTDLALAHILGVKYLQNGGKSDVFNLGSGLGYSVLEVINEVSKIKKVNYSIGPIREGDPAVLIADITKSKNILGFKPKYNLYDMVKSDMDYRMQFINKR